MSTTLDETRGGYQAQETANIEADEYTERLELLSEVGEKVSSASEVSELLDEILSINQRLLRVSAASVFLIDQEKGELHVQAAGGQSASALKQIRLKLNSGIVGWVAYHGEPLIINDVNSDERFNKDMDRVTGFITKSILAVPIIRGRKVIGVLEVLNKIDGRAFEDQDLRVLTGLASTEALVLLVSMAAVAKTNSKLSQTALDSCKSTVETLVTAADAREPYAWGHSQRVRKYTLLAAAAFSFPPEELRIIEFGGLLHDIGKIGISESILRKSGPLTAEEWYVVRKHPLRGANIVGQIPYLEKANNIVLYHHERYDGTGYPQGLKGEGIPIGARLVAVADAFDTMTIDHSYRAALNVEQAMDELVKGMRTQFCPAAVTALISGLKEQNKKPSTTETEKAPQDKPSVELQGAFQEKPNLEIPEVTQEKPGIEAPEKPRDKANKATHGTGVETYEGEVQLVVPSPVNFEQVRQFQERCPIPQDLLQVGNTDDYFGPEEHWIQNKAADIAARDWEIDFDDLPKEEQDNIWNQAHEAYHETLIGKAERDREYKEVGSYTEGYG